MDLRQTTPYTHFLHAIGWIVERDPKTKTYIYIRKLPLTPFSVLKIQRPEKLPSITLINKLIKRYRVVQTNIELPDDVHLSQLVVWKYRRQIIPFLPSTSIVLNLHLSESNLLAFLKPKTRYNLHLTQKKDLKVKVFSGTELIKHESLFEALFKMQKQNAKRLGIFMLPRTWFYKQIKALGNNCFGVMTYKEDILVAATFYMVSDDTVYYSHNGSTSDGRRLFAPTACVWRGILEGKRRKLHYFDFEGIYDPRSKVVRWQGFTRFKKGFGGKEIMFPGLYSKWHWPF